MSLSCVLLIMLILLFRLKIGNSIWMHQPHSAKRRTMDDTLQRNLFRNNSKKRKMHPQCSASEEIIRFAPLKPFVSLFCVFVLIMCMLIFMVDCDSIKFYSRFIITKWLWHNQLVRNANSIRFRSKTWFVLQY